MEIKSNTIYFRLADIADAEFIHGLRVDNAYNRYLSPVYGGVEKQKEWLIAYKNKEKLGSEYYFIIHKMSDKTPIGTVRLYDFIKDESSFCWGSWILNENKTKYAALETAILLYDFAFFTLKFKRCHMDVRKQNTKVLEFHKRFGVNFYAENDTDVFGHYYMEDYLKVRESIKNFIDANTSHSIQ